MASLIDHGRVNVLGVGIDAVDYESAVTRTIAAATDGRAYAVAALAVHGVMTGVLDEQHRYRLNHLDLVTPDGQPVRWALNWLTGAGLRDRVYGPELTLQLCQAAAAAGLSVYFYGSTKDVLRDLMDNLSERFPGLDIAGWEPSRFRTLSAEEQRSISERIVASGARLCFVGLGCPRQEVFAFEHRDALSMPVVAVGAAFDYHAGRVAEPPAWVQRRGLQWLYRLIQDPRRLWRRYLLLNPLFCLLLVLQRTHIWRPTIGLERAPIVPLGYG